MASSPPDFKNSAELHNYNCYVYFTKLVAFHGIVLSNFGRTFPDKAAIRAIEYTGKPWGPKPYSPEISYAKAYVALQKYLETHISLFKDHSFDSFIKSVYENNNQIYNRQYPIIQEAIDAFSEDLNVRMRIARRLHDEGSSQVDKSPSLAGQKKSRARNWFNSESRPQHSTNLPSQVHYSYQASNAPVQIHMGTQVSSDGRMSPLFLRYLEAKSRLQGGKNIVHVYFNNLGRDGFKHWAKNDARRTKALEDLEKTHSKLAVITLPSSGGVMSRNDHQRTNLKYTYDEVFQAFLQTAQQNGPDFHISSHIRKMLFKHGELEQLLKNSFKTMGFTPDSRLSQAQRQAVYVHFIKFELTNYILETLKPESFNISCKNAIDRGAYASSYYHLMKSIQLGKPLTKIEFEHMVHTPASVVYGRGMNRHLDILWNSIDVYVQANHQKKEFPDWLVIWRDRNCPNKRLDGLLKQRISEVSQGHEKLAKLLIEGQQTGAMGRRAILEVVGLIETFKKSPSDKNYHHMDLMIDRLTNPNPKYLGWRERLKQWLKETFCCYKAQRTQQINTFFSELKKELKPAQAMTSTKRSPS